MQIYEDDEDFSLAQNNTVSSPKELASQGVLFLLISNSKMTPIKRAELSKHVMKGVKPMVIKEVLQKIQKLLKRVRECPLVSKSVQSTSLLFRFSVFKSTASTTQLVNVVWI